MRCRECNVDLPDNYTACPLCDGKIFDDELQIKEIRTAPYPKAQPEPFKRNPFPIFILVWILLSASSFLLYKFEMIPLLISAAVFCAVPCIWTLILRPFLVKQLYAGNFIVMNLFPFAMTCMIFDKLMNGSFNQSYETYLPSIALAVFAVLMLYIFIKPKQSKRAASYPVLMIPICILAIAVLGLTQKTVPYLWCAVLVMCVFMISFLFATKPSETKEELKAKFSIQ